MEYTCKWMPTPKIKYNYFEYRRCKKLFFCKSPEHIIILRANAYVYMYMYCFLKLCKHLARWQKNQSNKSA